MLFDERLSCTRARSLNCNGKTSFHPLSCSPGESSSLSYKAMARDPKDLMTRSNNSFPCLMDLRSGSPFVRSKSGRSYNLVDSTAFGLTPHLMMLKDSQRGSFVTTAGTAFTLTLSAVPLAVTNACKNGSMILVKGVSVKLQAKILFFKFTHICARRLNKLVLNKASSLEPSLSKNSLSILISVIHIDE